ncbi:MAG TPA: phosphatidate cytidylyltransferase [Longimicrobiales bacterium]|nr:phosphatidate cytidylyltransferase [Longimicrobiales bacterium]
MARGELGRRVAVAAVGIPTAVVLIYLGGWYLGVLLAVAGGLSAWEYYRLAAARGVRAFVVPGVVFAVGIVLVSTALPGPGVGGPLWQLTVAFTLVLSVMAVLDRGVDEGPLTATAVTVMGALLPAGTLAFALFLRHMPVFGVGHGREAWTGAALVAYPLAVTWLNDTAAYFAGKAFGRRKLAPNVSPNKTWLGSEAGLVAGVVAGWLYARLVFGWWLALPLSPWLGALGGGLITVAAQFGDLSESILKREAGVKDSANLLPGHGGALDRLDALFLAFPVSYWYLALVFRWAGLAS